MPGMRKRFSCFHRGYGKFCHRCEQADEIEKLLAQGKKLVTHNPGPNGKKKTWTRKDMHEEMSRLREANAKK